MNEKNQTKKADEEYEAMEAAQKLTAGNASWLTQILSNLDVEQSPSTGQPGNKPR